MPTIIEYETSNEDGKDFIDVATESYLNIGAYELMHIENNEYNAMLTRVMEKSGFNRRDVNGNFFKYI